MTFLLWVGLAVLVISNGLLVLAMLVSVVRRGHARGVSCAEATKLEMLMLPLGAATIFIDAVALLVGVVLVFVA